MSEIDKSKYIFHFVICDCPQEKIHGYLWGGNRQLEVLVSSISSGKHLIDVLKPIIMRESGQEGFDALTKEIEESGLPVCLETLEAEADHLTEIDEGIEKMLEVSLRPQLTLVVSNG